MPERQIFQLPLHLPDAQPVRQRRVDVARELGQCMALFFTETVGHTHARQLPRQQDRHHAQVVDDGKQQSPQPFAVAPGLAPGMQRPDLIGCIQAIQQSFHCHPPLRRLPRQVGHRAAQRGQIEQQCCNQCGLVGRQQRQCVQGVAKQGPRHVIGLRGRQLLPGPRQRFAQCRGNGGHGRALQQSLQAIE